MVTTNLNKSLAGFSHQNRDEIASLLRRDHHSSLMYWRRYGVKEFFYYLVLNLYMYTCVHVHIEIYISSPQKNKWDMFTSCLLYFPHMVRNHPPSQPKETPGLSFVVLTSAAPVVEAKGSSPRSTGRRAKRRTSGGSVNKNHWERSTLRSPLPGELSVEWCLPSHKRLNQWACRSPWR